MSEKAPLVSVIIPLYNGARFITGAIESALGQTYPNMEIVVVDDASTDDGAELLAAYTKQITCIKRQVNGGVAACRNTGIAASHGDIIALLDQDDLWLPQRISRGVEAFLANPHAGLIAANTFIQNERKGTRSPCWKRVTRTGDRITKRLLIDNFICSAGVMMSRRALDEVGVFDETLYGADDFDLWYRIAGKFEVILIDEPLAVWRYRPASLSSHTDRMLLDVIRFYDKVLAVEEHDEEREIATRRRREVLFQLGTVRSLEGDDDAAEKIFRGLAEDDRLPFALGAAVRLHSVSPSLFRYSRAIFRLVRSLAGRGKREVMAEIELVI